MKPLLIVRKLIVDDRNELFDAQGMKYVEYPSDLAHVRRYAAEILKQIKVSHRSEEPGFTCIYGHLRLQVIVGLGHLFQQIGRITDGSIGILPKVTRRRCRIGPVADGIGGFFYQKVRISIAGS